MVFLRLDEMKMGKNGFESNVERGTMPAGSLTGIFQGCMDAIF
jgi:hypothetical protein